MNRTNEIETVAAELGYTESMECSALDYIIETAKASVMVNQKNIELVAQVEDIKTLCLTTDEVNQIKAEAGRAGYIEGAESWHCDAPLFLDEIASDAEEYAASIAKGDL